MSGFYINECNFKSGPKSVNATNGWDVIYAIKYDAVNADIVLRQPWTVISAADVTGATYQFTNLVVSSLALVVGDSDPDTDWNIEGTVSYQDGNGSYTAAFVASYAAPLTFSADPAIAGLNHLRVDAGQVSPTNFTVTSVTLDGSGGATTITLPADVVQQLRGMVDAAVMASATALFANSLAQVLDNDYAKSVNVPWLVPTYFTSALAIMPDDSTEGLLAILSTSKTGAALQALEARFNGNLFPIDDDINAAVFISPTILGQETFGKLLNQQTSDSVLGNLKTDPATGSVSNAGDVPLLFKYNETTGEGVFTSMTGGVEFNGSSYPATIPAGKLVFGIGTDAINVNVDPMTVSLGGGVSLEIVMHMSFALIVNAETNEVDVALNGQPTITTHFNAAEASRLETVTNIASVLVSTIASEAVAFAIDRISSSLASSSDAKLRQYQHDFFAAAAQSEKENRPVSFSIGLDKQMIVQYLDDRARTDVNVNSNEPVQLKSAFKSQLQLKTELALDIGADAPVAPARPVPQAIEMSNQSLLQNRSDIHVVPLDTSGDIPGPQTTPRRIVRGQMAVVLQEARREALTVRDPSRIVNAPRRQADVRAPRLDGAALTQRLQPVADEQTVAAQLASRGIVDRFCASVVTRIRGIAQERETNNESALKTQSYGSLFQEFAGSDRPLSDIRKLSVADCKALYASCANFMNDGYDKGWVDATAYLETVRRYNVLAAGTGTSATERPVIGSRPPPDREAQGNTPRPALDDGGANGQDLEPLLPEDSSDRRLDAARATKARYKITTRTTFLGSESVLSSTQQVRQGLLDEIALTTNGRAGNRRRGSPTATAALVGGIIRDAKRPAWAWFWGLGCYIGGVAAGYFGGSLLAQGLGDKFFDGGQQAREDAPAVMGAVQSALNTDPASLLFSSVKFPLMTPYADGINVNGAVPQPATVLKRASVNGALVLGAEILLNLS